MNRYVNELPCQTTKRRAETGRLITVQPSPLVIVSAFDGLQVAGCLVSFHSHVSVVPHRYMVFLARTNHTFAVAQAAQHLGIHLLESHHKETAAFFGATSGFTTQKRPPLLAAVARWDADPEGDRLLDGRRRAVHT